MLIDEPERRRVGGGSSRFHQPTDPAVYLWHHVRSTSVNSLCRYHRQYTLSPALCGCAGIVCMLRDMLSGVPCAAPVHGGSTLLVICLCASRRRAGECLSLRAGLSGQRAATGLLPASVKRFTRVPFGLAWPGPYRSPRAPLTEGSVDHTQGGQSGAWLVYPWTDPSPKDQKPGCSLSSSMNPPAKIKTLGTRLHRPRHSFLTGKLDTTNSPLPSSTRKITTQRDVDGTQPWYTDHNLAGTRYRRQRTAFQGWRMRFDHGHSPPGGQSV